MEITIGYLSLLKKEIVDQIKSDKEPFKELKNFCNIFEEIMTGKIQVTPSEISTYHKDILMRIVKLLFGKKN